MRRVLRRKRPIVNMCTWTNAVEYQLLENYKKEPVIWDTTYPLYKDRAVTAEAWQRISDIMDISVVELKRKRRSLLSSYRKYRKLVRDSIEAGGAVYKPVWFAYDFMESFLGDRSSATKEPESLEEQQEQPEEPDEEDEIDEDDEIDETYVFFEPTTEGSLRVEIKRERSVELEEAEEANSSPTPLKRTCSVDMETKTSSKSLQTNRQTSEFEEARASSKPQTKRKRSADLEDRSYMLSPLQIKRHPSKQEQARATPPLRIKREHSLDLEETSECTPPPQSETSSELEEAKAYIKQAVDVLKLALKTQHEEDDSDLYGRSLAGRLRKMPDMERLEFMHEIDGMYLRRRGIMPQPLRPCHVLRSPFNSGEEHNPGDQSPPLT